MSLKDRIKNDPKLKKLAIKAMTPRGQARPRLWIKWLINPLIHKKGNGSIIRKSVRLDVLPYNQFIVGTNSTIEDYAVVNNGVGDVIIGKNVIVGIGTVLLGPLVLGNDVMLGQHVIISALNHDYEDITIPINKQPNTVKQIIIDDETLIGANSIVTAGVRIGKHSVIAAGSVVTKDVPALTLAAGNPAKIIKQYNPGTKKWERIKE